MTPKQEALQIYRDFESVVPETVHSWKTVKACSILHVEDVLSILDNIYNITERGSNIEKDIVRENQHYSEVLDELKSYPNKAF